MRRTRARQTLSVVVLATASLLGCAAGFDRSDAESDAWVFVPLDVASRWDAASGDGQPVDVLDPDAQASDTPGTETVLFGPPDANLQDHAAPPSDDGRPAPDVALALDGSGADSVAMDILASEASAMDVVASDTFGVDTTTRDSAASDAIESDTTSSRDGSTSADVMTVDPDAAAVPAACARLPRLPKVLYLSADDSASVASAQIARRMIHAHQEVPAALIRTYEFLNYYNVPYAPAAAGTVRTVAQVRRAADPASLEFQVGVQSESRAIAGVRPMVVTLVIDTSGSMAFDHRLERAQAVVRAIAASLRRGDIVSIVTWNTDWSIILSGYRVTGPADPTVIGAAGGLRAGGSTDLHAGLVNGYELARRYFDGSRLNRVVLVSDGDANAGITDERIIAEASHRAEGEEIYLVGVGVGDGFNDTLMNTVTDRGRGAYVYVDTDAEASRIFVDRFVEFMDIAVRSVRLEVTLPWYMRVEEFHGEAISHEAREVDPQHLAPNDSTVFHQELRACDASMISTADTVLLRATYESRDGRVPQSQILSTTLGAMMVGPQRELARGSAIVAYAEALRRASELFGTARWSDAATVLRAAQRQVDAVRAAEPDAGLAEISALIDEYVRWFSR